MCGYLKQVGPVYDGDVNPDTAITAVFRLSPPHAAALKRLGISTVRDLLYHLPARYDQGGEQAAIAGLAPGSEATIFGTISKLETRRSWKRKIPVGEATLRDASGAIKIMWFHQPYLAKKFSEGQFVKAVGQIGGSGDKLYLANPHVEPADPADAGLFSAPHENADASALFAVYPETRGVSSLWMRHAIAKVIAGGVLQQMDDPIPEETRARLHLPHLADALLAIHTPERIAHAQAARKRFSFEEMFVLQTVRAIERARNDVLEGSVIPDAARKSHDFLASLPFAPTGAQRRAIEDICRDFDTGRPMARLLEGDVGSGKTLVAAATAYAAITSRPPNRTSGTLQVAYMAPTEILAKQHFDSFIEYFRELPINIALMTGSGCWKFPSKSAPGTATSISRSQLLKWVAGGEIAMLVGTHALIQKSVHFKNLAYCIVDEQHRFGTKQRRALARKDNASPHFLSMTATPIPRTLALTMYGDLDISVLDELPPGRVKIETQIVKKNERARAYERIHEELRSGRQAYVICPRIDEPDPKKETALIAKSAKAEAARLQKDVFIEYSVGLLHGGMKPAEKDAVMARFSAHDIDVLVATSVVEVGVNVPNATAIMVEGAERFGLSQLHQLRGRVMRSSHPPACFLVPETSSEVSLKRLRTLAKSQDGFELAEADLAARGAGDLLGKRQWGISDLGMEALKNPKLIAAAREEAQQLVAHDPELGSHPALRRRIMQTDSVHPE